MFVKARRNESPYLPQHKRRGKIESGYKRNLEVYRKGFRRIIDHQTNACDLRYGFGYKLEQLHREVPTNRKTSGHGDERLDDSIPQFLKVVQERHLIEHRGKRYEQLKRSAPQLAPVEIEWTVGMNGCRTHRQFSRECS